MDDSQLEAFIICIEKEVRVGNRTTRTFSTIGWKNIVEGMSVRTGKKYAPKQLRSKFNHIRVKYKAFVSLLAETGVGYNAETGMVIVENERWPRLMKVNNHYGEFRKKGCKHFDKLTTIFRGIHPTGAHVHTSTNPPIINQAPSHHATIHSSFEIDDLAELDGHEISPSPEPYGKKPKKESFDSTMSDVMVQMKDKANMKCDRIEKAIKEALSSNMKTVHEKCQVEVNSPDKTKGDFKLC
ncbi:uncharacterized protein LOC132296589 [Cornus florida]|uniref:uncharacterized protein LOC132296589 n=1 Tax=Cornus florida TaxID=4283 RepID=UPI0028971E17|nr:uncharacterized protein LOC132296589 [Cornus florida]XP_059650760.1 uncharacterized protein LOC132296589 [Cornus florida]XP_059650763.1 uncharacterized protein LOC132296589 [Cornus florida]XP_059650768.1 uncharacterized protein LOC132296589 [Cornus florida]